MSQCSISLLKAETQCWVGQTTYDPCLREMFLIVKKLNNTYRTLKVIYTKKFNLFLENILCFTFGNSSVLTKIHSFQQYTQCRVRI